MGRRKFASRAKSQHLPRRSWRGKVAAILTFLIVTGLGNSVHNLFTRVQPLPAASGWRLETTQKCDK
jgi:hypothetical protein